SGWSGATCSSCSRCSSTGSVRCSSDRRGNGPFPRGGVPDVISLRYHIVSLVAVFLALALGIVVGSTVLQEGTVSVLRATGERGRPGSEKNSRENVALKQDKARLEAFGAAYLPELIQGRLKGRPVVLVDT